MPLSAYQQAWWRFFAGVLVASLLGLGALFWGGRHVYGRYFSLPAKLRLALSENRLKLLYQPIVDMRTGQWRGAEALLRWSLDGQAISPEVFIPLAEKSGLIRELTRWVCW